MPLLLLLLLLLLLPDVVGVALLLHLHLHGVARVVEAALEGKGMIEYIFKSTSGAKSFYLVLAAVAAAGGRGGGGRRAGALFSLPKEKRPLIFAQWRNEVNIFSPALAVSDGAFVLKVFDLKKRRSRDAFNYTLCFIHLLTKAASLRLAEASSPLLTAWVRASGLSSSDEES